MVKSVRLLICSLVFVFIGFSIVLAAPENRDCSGCPQPDAGITNNTDPEPTTPTNKKLCCWAW